MLLFSTRVFDIFIGWTVLFPSELLHKCFPRAVTLLTTCKTSPKAHHVNMPGEVHIFRWYPAAIVADAGWRSGHQRPYITWTGNLGPSRSCSRDNEKRAARPVAGAASGIIIGSSRGGGGPQGSISHPSLLHAAPLLPSSASSPSSPPL